MVFKLSAEQVKYLLQQPETGMGYQFVAARRAGYSSKEKYLILNAEVVIEVDREEVVYIDEVVKKGVLSATEKSNVITLVDIAVLPAETKDINPMGGIKSAVEYSKGEEVFVRLSIFDADKRIDKTNKRLLPGSYTTTMPEYFNCKIAHANLTEFLSLPYDTIKWAFHFRVAKKDPLQREKALPRHQKPGGGSEIYFPNGTSENTLLRQTPH